MGSSHLKWGNDDECENCGLSESKVMGGILNDHQTIWMELVKENDRLRNALQEIADYPLSDYGGVIARKALGLEE